MGTNDGLISQNICTNGADEIIRNNEALFDSSEDLYIMEGLNELDNHPSSNFSLNMSLPFLHTFSAQSAFTKFIKSQPKAAVVTSRNGQVLQKRCFRFLGKIEEERKIASEMPSPASVNNFRDPKPKKGFQKKTAFQHMVAERKRRDKLKQLFSNLYSLLPGRNSKKDKHSILSNITSYVTELKHRVAQLEEWNQTLEESSPRNILDHEEANNTLGRTLVYRCSEVILEQSNDISWQVNIRINVATNHVSCPTSLFIKILDQIRVEKLDVLSIHLHRKAFLLHCHILVEPKGQIWDSSKWKEFGNSLRVTLK